MLPDLFGLLAAALVLAACVRVSRFLRRGRVIPAQDRPAARPAGLAGGAAVPRPEVQPRSEATGPFGYDNGLMVETGEGGDDG